MTNDFNGTSNWTMATGTKPGERFVYRETPSNPVTHPAPEALSRARTRSESKTVR